MEGKISVIVLAHGDEKELNRCVDRILNQNYENYELIVVSTQKNSELEEKANNSDLMTLYIKDVDKLEDLRAYALNKADGDRILFVEPNDFLIDEQSITTLNEVYTQKNADMLLNKFMTLRDGKFYFINKKIENVSTNKFLFYQFDNIEFRKLAGVLLKKSLFGKIDSDDLLKPDQVLLNSLSREAQNIVFDCQNKYIYDEVNGNRLPELITGKESELYFSNIYKLVRKIKKSNYTSKISEKVSITLCIDENLVEHVGVLLYSISVNTSSFVDVYIIHDNLSYSSLEKLTELDKSFPTIKINIIKIPDNIQNQLNKISLEGNKLPVTSCYRFILADLLPSLDRIIYLDVDTLVLRDLTELWRTDLEGKFIGVVKDALINLNVAQKIVSERKSYFNSGMLLMDLNLFRKYDICNDLVDFAIDVAEYCEYGDQDILNYYFIDGYKLLDIKWNCGRELLEDREKEVGIVHFYGLEKPWNNMVYTFYVRENIINMEHIYKLYQYRFLQKSKSLKNNKVTIVVTLDIFKYSKTLESVLLQSYCNIEVKVIDVSQDDRVKAKVRKLQLYYPNLKYYEVTLNDNFSRVMNFVIKNSSEHIFFVKSPYVLLSKTISDLMEIILENQADIALVEYRTYKLSKFMYYVVEKDNQLEDISGQSKLNSLNGCLIKKKIFDAVGVLNFEDNESLMATILEKADKVMVKHSDYLIKVFD
ncbi:glycosyltransferase [Ligilactobacillus salivarius]|uniref:Family 8 glycosyl transferase n=1 Tax=Ligilactobacillus salivarius TaxID=1624 RepID=A0A1D7TQ61_9LACO|nr:glycosyltransferase [Ligilactobacillus salivarius]AOO73098.1 family 8 glycosyl transferase [Ligilactobacillus salivarius]UDE97344.1 glycosyltransferase [Ligilactobacillus salivarius]UUV96463.1 glycosyltransferase [Ligilactobacillus salivarius]